MDQSLSETLARWCLGVRFGDLPPDVVEATKLRILDSIGLAIAGVGSEAGIAATGAVPQLGGIGPCRVLGTAICTSPGLAAFANGTLAHALDYDDTHNETIVHSSSVIVPTALALAQTGPVSGRDLIAAVAVGNELDCRIGLIAPGMFHKYGMHSTGKIGTFGAAYTAGRLLGLDVARTCHAAGIAGSQASGICECWVDGTLVKCMHPGWSAQAGITAAILAKAGMTGPRTVFEGRFGFFRAHVQDPDYCFDFAHATTALGETWESRVMSFKPFAAAHVIHPFIDAILALYREEGLRADEVERIVCQIAAFMVPIVCEPAAEKRRPVSTAQARVSLQYTLAEALARGSLGVRAYSDAARADPAILALADRIDYEVDPTQTDRSRFRGVVVAHTRDGRSLRRIEAFNRGSPQNPMSADDVRAKFIENATLLLAPDRARRIADMVANLEQCAEVASLVESCAVPA